MVYLSVGEGEVVYLRWKVYKYIYMCIMLYIYKNVKCYLF